MLPHHPGVIRKSDPAQNTGSDLDGSTVGDHLVCPKCASRCMPVVYENDTPAFDPEQTVVETEEEEEQRAAREWQDDGRKGRVLVRRSEELDCVAAATGVRGWRTVFRQL